MTNNIAYLAPHAAKPWYQLFIAPVAPIVEISEIALEYMRHYVGQAKGEVGWYGTVTKTAGETPQDADHYLIDRVYLVSQQVHATTTEIDGDATADLAMQFLQEDNWDVDLRANRLRLWGHSHVNMETDPSSQDDAQMVYFSNSMPYMLRLIANKKGRVTIDVYDYTKGLIWNDVRWSIESSDAIGAEIRREMAAKVRQIPPVVKTKTLPYKYGATKGGDLTQQPSGYYGTPTLPFTGTVVQPTDAELREIEDEEDGLAAINPHWDGQARLSSEGVVNVDPEDEDNDESGMYDLEGFSISNKEIRESGLTRTELMAQGFAQIPEDLISDICGNLKDFPEDLLPSQGGARLRPLSGHRGKVTVQTPMRQKR